MRHGDNIPLEALLAVPEGAVALAAAPSLNKFGFLFDPSLERLPAEDDATKQQIIAGLTALGAAMTSRPATGDSTIEAPMTYLGQFIDHDITRSSILSNVASQIDDPLFPIVPPGSLDATIRNVRTATTELDSLYGTSAVDADGKFDLGKLSGEVDTENDLPRDPNGKPQIGDDRNDENLAVAQTHLAFLKFHNAVMEKEGVSSDEARVIVTQHYQWLLIHDFLKKMVDPSYVDNVLVFGNRFFKPTEDEFFMPLEFAMAGYRMGHSMIRSDYRWNPTFDPASLLQLFTFSSSGGSVPAPANWVIDWGMFSGNKTFKLDTAITDPLSNIPGIGINLAVRNLRRGYMFGLPTGQAVAETVLFDRSLILSPAEILDNSTDDERAALEANDFHIKSPLWYYILKEAEVRESGERLGPVGTAIVAEVFVALVARSKHSIFATPGYKPSLTGDNFTFQNLLEYTDLI